MLLLEGSALVYLHIGQSIYITVTNTSATLGVKYTREQNDLPSMGS